MPIVSAKYGNHDIFNPKGRRWPAFDVPYDDVLMWLNEETIGIWARVIGSSNKYNDIIGNEETTKDGRVFMGYRIHQDEMSRRDNMKKIDMPILSDYEIMWFENEQDAISFKMRWS